MEYYSSLKKKDVLPFATRWMNVEAIMPIEISHTEGYKMQDHTLIIYGI